MGATLVIEGTRIASISTREERRPLPGDRVIDAEGRTLIPGLFNCHVHLQLDAGPSPLTSLGEETSGMSLLRAAKRASQMLRRGITTVRDCGAKDAQIIHLRDAIARGYADGPRIFACGRAICAAGGHATVVADPVENERDVANVAQRQLEAGADFLKAMGTGGFGKDGERLDHSELTVGQIRVAAEAAHAARRRLTVHAYGTEGIRNAIAGGADSIEHGTFVDDETIALLRSRGVYLVPTLTNTYRVSTEGAAGNVAEYIVKTASGVFPTMMANARRAHQAGVKMAVGTDAGSWLNPHTDITTELRLRIKAGVTPLDVLTMATLWSAECLGIADEVGTLQPGKRADLLLLNGDPLADIAAVDRIHAVWKDGKEVSVEEHLD